MPQLLSSETAARYFSTMLYADTNLFYNIAVTASPEPLLSRRTLTVLNLLGTEPLRSSPVATTDSLVRQLRTYSDLLSALGVQWVLSPRSLREIAALEFRELIPIGGEAAVYRYAVRGNKPPAYVLPAVSLYEPSENDIAVRLLQNYQQARTVVECPGCSGRHDSSGLGSFTVQEWSPTSVRIAVVTPDDQWMAVRRAALPGIKVTIDGRPAPFAFAHGIIVALFVPQGNHTVTVSYSYLQLLKNSLQILFGGPCLWCTPS